MPNKKNQTLSPVGNSLPSVLFSEKEQNSIAAYKVDQILENSESQLNEAISDFYSTLVGQKVEIQAEDAYYLSHWGALIFSDCREEIAKNKLLIDRTLKIGAFCFPYSPSPQVPLAAYFNLKERYQCSLGKKDYWSSYFFFLEYLIAEESIDSHHKLGFLGGLLKFSEINKENLTHYFVEKILCILALPQTRKLLGQKESQVYRTPYMPNYTILFLQPTAFWTEMGIVGMGKENWERKLLQKLTGIIHADRIFMQENNLTPISTIEMEIKKFIEFLANFIGTFQLNEGKEIIEKLFSFLKNEQHSLFELFSSETLKKKLEVFNQKNEEMLQQMILEEERTAALVQEKNEKKIKRAKKKVRKRKDKKFNLFVRLNTLLGLFSKSLENSISYAEQSINIVGTKNKNKLEQKIKSVMGQLYENIIDIYKLLDLKAPAYFKSNFQALLLEIETKINGVNIFNVTEIDFLNQKIIEIKHMMTKAQTACVAISEEFVQIFNFENNLQQGLQAIFLTINQDKNLSPEEMVEFNKCKQQIEKLSQKIYFLTVVITQYKQIFDIPNEISEKLDKFKWNINSLNCLFQEFSTGLGTSQPSAETKQTVGIQESVQYGMEEVLIWYQNYLNWEKNFKGQLFKTMEIIHRLPYITFAQGRGTLISIFIKKIKSYKEQLEEKKTILKTELTTKKINKKIKRFLNNRFREEKLELQDLCDQIDSLIILLEIYAKEKGEFSKKTGEQRYAFSGLLCSFEKFIHVVKESEEKFIKEKTVAAAAFSKCENLNREKYHESREILFRNRHYLRQMSKDLQRIFVFGHLSQIKPTSLLVSGEREEIIYPHLFFNAIANEHPLKSSSLFKSNITEYFAKV